MEYYNWILVFHIMSILSWMAMLFYLPRLFVYHTENKDKKEFVEVVKIQELKLFKYIGVPAMWATIISGLLMVTLNDSIFTSGAWMHAKLTFVAILIAYHFSLGHFRKQLENEVCEKSGKFFRVWNEIPTLISLAIVIFVIIKPF